MHIERYNYLKYNCCTAPVVILPYYYYEINYSYKLGLRWYEMLGHLVRLKINKWLHRNPSCREHEKINCEGP